MRMTRSEFRDWPHKAITLLGAFDAGKAALAGRLPKTEWFHYSSDYRIGTHYLSEPILDNVKRQAMQVPFLRDLLRSDSIYIANNVKVHNTAPIATFLGKLGRVDLDGLRFEEFQRRQRLYRDAETGAMKDVAAFIEKGRQIYGYDHFVNDTSDSLCEIDDEAARRVLVEHTLIVYLEPDAALLRELVRRAAERPEPVYFQPDFLARRLEEYLALHGPSGADAVEPEAFLGWVGPALVEHRHARYRALADAHGYTLDASAARDAASPQSALELIECVL